MPEIIVSAGSESERDAPVVLRERVTEDNLASAHYTAQLMERIGWAVVDARAAEGAGAPGRARRDRGQGETAAPSESAARNFGAPSS